LAHSCLARRNQPKRNDSGPTHALRWTSVFVCPLTAEVFPSGRYGDPATYAAVPCPLPGSDASDPYAHEVVWYSKKTSAEHGAASRALDCSLARDADRGVWGASARVGMDEPHLKPDMSIPPFVPIQVRGNIESRQAEILQRHGQSG
jgi:hypothetical protein